MLAPGIEFAPEGLEGYDAAAARFPMPGRPGRKAPPGRAAPCRPRRRAGGDDHSSKSLSLSPGSLRTCQPHGPVVSAPPRAKLLLLDGKDRFTKDALFKAAWEARYPNLEWQGLSAGARLRRVDGKTGLIETDFDRFSPTSPTSFLLSGRLRSCAARGWTAARAGAPSNPRPLNRP